MTLNGDADALNLGSVAGAFMSVDGDLDEVDTWDRVLLPAEVAQLSAARATAPEIWREGESHAYRYEITIRDDEDAVWNSSADVTLRWEMRNR